MPVSVHVYLRQLLRKTDAEIATIATQAHKVIGGGITSISALNQSATFNAAQAGMVLEAVEVAQTMRAADPSAGPDGAPRTAGYRMSFSDAQSPRGTTWGC